MLVSGCGPDKEPDEIHTIRAGYVCGPDAETDVTLALDALGDFQPSNSTFTIVDDDAKGAALPFPVNTRGVKATAEIGQKRWSGVGLAHGNDISFSLWPVETGCVLWKPSPTENAFPLDAVGTSFGYSPDQRVMLVAGSSYQLGDPRALVADLATGTVEQIEDPKTLAFSSVTAFGSDKFLVAGGIDPRNATSPGDTARVFDIASRRYEAEEVALTRVRSRHGAVVMASGETLLVGGVDNDDSASSTLETVSPTAPRSSAASDENLTQLFFARVSPIALRLSDDSIFVGGGRSGPNPDAAAVSALEFLDSKASKVLRVIENVKDGEVRVGRVHAFAGLPGGGVLAVGLCLSSAQDDDCDLDNDQRQSRSYAWIHPDGEIHTFDTLLPKLESVELVPGSDGMPWLFSRTSTPPQDIWLRFEPWSGGFQIQLNAPSTGPAPSPLLDPCKCIQTSCQTEIGTCDLDPDCRALYDCVESDSACGFPRCKAQEPAGIALFAQTVENCATSRCGPRRLSAPVTIDPGLMVWLEQTQDALGNHPSLVGFRFDTRNIFASQLDPFVAEDTLHIAPSVTPYPIDPESGIRYDGGLVLSHSNVEATVADATYADVDITLATTGSLPRVRLGEVVVGDMVNGIACFWPNGAADAQLHIARRGTTLTVSRGAESTTCPISSGRKGISVLGPLADQSTIERLEIQRR